MSDYQRDAIKAVKATANIPNFAYRGDLPIGETWAFTIARHRDSGLLAESNWHVITTDMESRFPDDCIVVGASHWAVGWIDHFAVRMLDDNGNVTSAGIAILEWQGALENYPVASDDDYSNREYEACLSNIDSELGRINVIGDRPDASEVFSWFWENKQSAVENTDDQGAYPSEDEIKEALTAMGCKLEDK